MNLSTRTRLSTPSAEEAENVAAALYRTADRLQEAVAIVDIMARAEWQTIEDEKAAYETLVFQAEDIVKALRSIALRLDRAVLGTYTEPPSILEEVQS